MTAGRTNHTKFACSRHPAEQPLPPWKAECKVPPEGWWCSRPAGHEGPCAARPMPGVATDTVEGADGQLPEDMSALRELRLWHWTKYEQCRALELKYRYDVLCFRHDKKADDYKRKATIHIKAVQALNDLFPVGDTAEQDAAK